MSASAFKATYSDWKLVRTRQVVQIVFEVPLSDADGAYEILGGMPNSSKERWFGIAAIVPPKAEAPASPGQAVPTPDRAKRDWRDLQPAAQAGIRCAEPTFRAFLREARNYPAVDDETEAAGVVRELCGVKSRVELGTKHAARVLWHQLDSEYQAWLAKERVGA